MTRPRNPLPRPGALPPLALAAALLAPLAIPPALADPATPELAARAAGLSGMALRMDAPVQAEVAATLRRMTDSELRLTYARIHATFREFLGHDDLSVARALLDYATLTQAELDWRNLARPEGTESAAGMAIAFELVL